MSTPDDNSLLAQFAGIALQALVQRDHAGNSIHAALVQEAYRAAELMLREHKRCTAGSAPAPAAEISLPLSAVEKIVRGELDRQKNPQVLTTVGPFAEKLLDAMRRASSDGHEHGNG